MDDLNNFKNWQIGTFADELADAKYDLGLYDDFWEWYEKHYPETKHELFDKFMVEFSKTCKDAIRKEVADRINFSSIEVKA